jgi:hypothetical protein
MAITLNVATELVVYETYPKLCEYLIKNSIDSDACLVEYLQEQGYTVDYYYLNTSSDRGRYITFNDDKQYLDFVLRHS